MHTKHGTKIHRVASGWLDWVRCSLKQHSSSSSSHQLSIGMTCMVGKQGRSRRDIVGAARVTALQVGAEGPHIAAAAVAAGIAALLGGVDRVAGAVAIHVDGQHISAHVCLQAGLLRQLQLRTSSICLASQEHSTIPGECWELTEPWPSLTARLRQHGHMQGRMCHIIELHPWCGTISGEQ